MTDLVKRLREWTVLTGDMTDIHKEAADRIEQLEEAVAEKQSSIKWYDIQYKSALARIEELEKRIEFLLEERALLTKGVPIRDLRSSSSRPDGSSQSHSEHEQDAT